MILAIYGNSYKTTTAINIATLLARYNQQKSVVLVSLDKFQPIMPIIFPSKRETSSLGELMSAPEAISSSNLLSYTQTCNGNIGVIGYSQGENTTSYAPPLPERIDDFFVAMRSAYDFVVVDCTIDIRSRFVAKALIHADKVIDLISCDVFGASWFCSQLPILQNIQYKYDEKFLKILCFSSAFLSDENKMSELIGSKISGKIPYSKEAVRIINEGLAFGEICDKKYREALCSIISLASNTEIDTAYDPEDTEKIRRSLNEAEREN